MIPSGTVGKLENLGGEPFSPLEELQVMNMVSRESGRPGHVHARAVARLLARHVPRDPRRDARDERRRCAAVPAGVVAADRSGHRSVGLPRVPAAAHVHAPRVAAARRAGARDGQARGEGGDPRRARPARRRARLDGQRVRPLPAGGTGHLPARRPGRLRAADVGVPRCSCRGHRRRHPQRDVRLPARAGRTA